MPKSYVEIEEQTVGPQIAYELDRIAVELAANLLSADFLSVDGAKETTTGIASDIPKALVVSHSKYTKKTYEAIAEAGIATIAPMMGDARLDVNPKLAYGKVPFGKTPSKALFTNAYAVLEAAKEADVHCIFLGMDCDILARDNRFLLRAANLGIRVFRPLAEVATMEHWVEAEPVSLTDDPNSKVPTTWRTCHKCKLTFDNAEFIEGSYACPHCGTLARLNSDERIEQVLDKGTFKEWDAKLEDKDPLEFPGYQEKIAAQRAKTGRHEAVRIGKGKIGGYPVAIGFMDSEFFMGSMGSVVGEKVTRLFDRATKKRLPVILFCASGGARMQEGLASLMQMAKTACAVERHSNAGLLYISVLTDPTTGGVTASFATLGDIILAEPGALIGFAGQRVIRDTIKQELPEGFQTAEFALEHGLIDAIVRRHRMKDALEMLLELHAPTPRESVGNSGAAGGYADAGNFGAAGAAGAEGAGSPLGNAGAGTSGAAGAAGASNQEEREFCEHGRVPLKSKKSENRNLISMLAEKIPIVKVASSAWESVQLARNTRRPTAQTYLRGITEKFFELHGDRAFADDPAIVAGLAIINGRPVTIITQEKGVDLQDRIQRHFGCPMPEGYRKTARLMRQAEKFGRPIVCLVDTQGAFCGTEAEERGQGNAIAENLALMASLHVPVISVLLGEGGSGGALALAVANRVAMQQNAVYSVLSPEGFASILWKDGKRASEAADVMKMNAVQVQELGVVDDVISEGAAAAHENVEEAVANVRAYIEAALEDLCFMDPDELMTQRQSRFSKF